MKKIKYIFLAITLLQSVSQAGLFWDYRIGVKQFQNGNYDFSRNYFEDYVLNNPNDKNGYYWLAKTYQKLTPSEENKHKIKENFKKSFELSYLEKDIEETIFASDNISEEEDYFDMASLYFEKGDFKETELYADMILKVNPKSASAYFIKAQIANINNDEQKAKEFLNQAIILNNNFLKTKLAKKFEINIVPETSKETYNFFILDSYYNGNIKEAINNAVKLLAIDLDDVESYVILANLYFEDGQIEKAEEKLIQAKNLNKETLKLNLLEAKIANAKEEKTRELKALLGAYKLNPNNEEMLYKLGEYYFLQKDWENSRKYFENLVNIDNFFYEAYFGYIYSLINLGKADLALYEARKLSNLNPNASDTEFLFAKICELNGEFNQALAYLNKAIEKSENVKYYIEKAKINYILEDYPQTIMDLKEANFSINSFSDEQEINEYFAKTYLKMKDIENSRKYIEIQKNLDKNRIIYKYNLYNLYKLQGNEHQSEELLKSLKKFKPVKLMDFIDLSEFYFEQKGLDEAINLLNLGIKKYSDKIELYYQQIKLCYRAKNQKKLKQIIEKRNKLY